MHEDETETTCQPQSVRWMLHVRDENVFRWNDWNSISILPGKTLYVVWRGAGLVISLHLGGPSAGLSLSKLIAIKTTKSHLTMFSTQEKQHCLLCVSGNVPTDRATQSEPSGQLRLPARNRRTGKEYQFIGLPQESVPFSPKMACPRLQQCDSGKLILALKESCRLDTRRNRVDGLFYRHF